MKIVGKYSETPIVKLFQNGFEIWQFHRIRDALRRYKNEEINMSYALIANEISVYTGIDVKKVALTRFINGYYGNDKSGNPRQPELKLLLAVASYLADDDIDYLDLDQLRIKKINSSLPQQLFNYIDSDSASKSKLPSAALESIFVSKNSSKDTIRYSLRKPKNVDYIFVRESVKSGNMRKYGNIEQFKREADGWSVVLPSNTPLFFLKDTIFQKVTIRVGISPIINLKDEKFHEKFSVIDHSKLMLSEDTNYSSETDDDFQNLTIENIITFIKDKCD